jgi:hypothetical protein
MHPVKITSLNRNKRTFIVGSPQKEEYPENSILDLIQKLWFNKILSNIIGCYNISAASDLCINIPSSELILKVMKPNLVCGYFVDIENISNIVKKNRWYISNSIYVVYKDTKYDLKYTGCVIQIMVGGTMSVTFNNSCYYNFSAHSLQAYKEKFVFNLKANALSHWNFDVENSLVNREKEKGIVLCRFNLNTLYTDTVYKLTRFKSGKLRPEKKDNNYRAGNLLWNRISLQYFYKKYIEAIENDSNLDVTALDSNVTKCLTSELEKEIQLEIAVEKL